MNNKKCTIYHQDQVCKIIGGQIMKTYNLIILIFYLITNIYTQEIREGMKLSEVYEHFGTPVGTLQMGNKTILSYKEITITLSDKVVCGYNKLYSTSGANSSVRPEPKVESNEYIEETTRPLVKTEGIEISYVGWNITKTPKTIDSLYDFNLSYVLVNNYKKSIKYINGKLEYRDKLGKCLYATQIKRDLHMTAYGGSAKDSGTYPIYNSISDYNLLIRLPPSEVEVTICVRGLVFDDNTKISY